MDRGRVGQVGQEGREAGNQSDYLLWLCDHFRKSGTTCDHIAGGFITIHEANHVPPSLPANPGCPTCSASQLLSLIPSATSVLAGDVPSNVSSAGVRYSDGTVQVAATDLSSNAFALPWGQVRSWSNGTGYAVNSDNGNGWVDSNMPLLHTSTETPARWRPSPTAPRPLTST